MLLKTWRKFNAKQFYCFDGEASTGTAAGTGATGSEGGAGAAGSGGPVTSTQVSTSPGSATIDVPTSASGSSGAPAGNSGGSGGGVDWKTIIPADMHAKPYFKSILESADPGAELVKQFDNAQTLIGKRPAGIPGDTATEEDWTAYKASTRPANADAYDLKPLDLGPEKKNVSDFVNSFRDDEFMKTVKQDAFDEGLSKHQFERFVQKYEQRFATKFDKQFTEAARVKQQTEADFETMAGKLFSGDRDAALALGKKSIAESLPENIRGYLDGLPNEALMMLCAQAQFYERKYNGTDSILKGGTTAPGEDEAGLRKQLGEVMSSSAFQDKFGSGYESARNQAKQIAERIAQLQSTARR